MSQNITNIKKRINTIASTRKITNSMKLVSGVKVRKLTKEFDMNSLFFKELNSLFENAFYIDNFVNQEEILNSKYIALKKNTHKKLYIIIMSNLGLCGSYNSQIYKYFESIYKEGDEVILIGNKCLSYFKKGITRYLDFINITHNLNVENITLLTTYILEKYDKNEYESINCIYTKYINSLSFKPTNYRLLPLDIKKREDHNGYGPIYEASKDEFSLNFVPMYIKNTLLHLFYESSLCEETSRRNSMDNANKNIDDLMYDLNIEYNKARQGAITSQITEVVSGAESIKNS